MTTFAPYSNICPISGHTQVEVDVSDGQTTQEQVTVNLGGTYYSGTLDVVSGVLTVDKGYTEFDGSSDENWNRHSYSTDTVNAFYIFANLGQKNIQDGKNGQFNQIRLGSISQSSVDGNAVGFVGRDTVQLRLDAFKSTTELKAYFAEHPLQVVYELATPIPIQLIPTPVKANVGENHLSAPLEGQEITESKYRELFTWDEVEEIAQKIATSAVADLRCYQSQDGAYGMLAYVDSGTVFYDWVAASPSVKLLSTISVMPPLDEIEFTDSSIYSSSICELIVVGDSDVPVVTHVKVTSGKVVFTLSEALDNTIQCACKVTNRNL